MKNIDFAKCALKQLFVYFVAVFSITSCTITDTGKVEKLMKQYAKSNIGDYKSFEIIEVDSIKDVYSNLLEESILINLCNKFYFFVDSLNSIETTKSSIEDYLTDNEYSLKELYRQRRNASWNFIHSFSTSSYLNVLYAESDIGSIEDAIDRVEQNYKEAKSYKNSIMAISNDIIDSLNVVKQMVASFCFDYVPKYLGKEAVVKCRFKDENGNMKVESYHVIMNEQLTSIVSLNSTSEIEPVSNRIQDFVAKIMNEYDKEQEVDFEDVIDLSEKSGQNNQHSRCVVIDGTELRMRLGPSTNAVTFKRADGSNCHPNKGEKYPYLGESGDFYKIDFNGNELWVSKQYTHLE